LHFALYEVFVQDEIKERGKQKPQGDADPTQADSYFSCSFAFHARFFS
jgi:hypothetical protein